jgi:aconitase A
VKASWDALEAKRGLLFEWDAASNYIVEPPFFASNDVGFAMAQRFEGVRVLGVYGDNLNTDHVSPGGEIPADSPAGQYLQSVGVKPAAFNSYVGRRGNHHVMMRGTYGNVRIRNRMANGREGWWTTIYPERLCSLGCRLSLWTAHCHRRGQLRPVRNQREQRVCYSRGGAGRHCSPGTEAMFGQRFTE